MKTIFGVYILAVVNALGYVDPIHVSTFLSQKGEISLGEIDGPTPYWQILES